MKPYYEHAGITIYHGDCREVLPTFAQDSIDLIVTDPPYGVRWCSNFRQNSFAEIIGDESREAGEIGLALSLRILRDRRHAYVFGRFNFTGLPITEPVELIWDKENWACGDLSAPWAKQHEYLQFLVKTESQAHRDYGAGRLAARLRKGSILRGSAPSRNGDNHPTEKPISILRELIESSSRIGEKVLDPFMGSGTTAKASALESRRFIGIEIEEKYCEIAAKRLSQGVFQF